MVIKVLGTGCPTCKALEKAIKDTVDELGIDAKVTKEEDIMKIMEYGVMRTPGLVIDDKVVLSGRVPSPKELKEIFTQ
ncbi:MAG: TM0996/MTH895 family glutaredoxin-like protein [Bacteroidetes bacterium]|nr:TM0996/MTH895 family glutaredoxin-like protein [Bacteroidota bacterium]